MSWTVMNNAKVLRDSTTGELAIQCGCGAEPTPLNGGSGGGASSWDDLTGKPFGKEIEEVVLFETTAVHDSDYQHSFYYSTCPNLLNEITHIEINGVRHSFVNTITGNAGWQYFPLYGNSSLYEDVNGDLPLQSSIDTGEAYCLLDKMGTEFEDERVYEILLYAAEKGDIPVKFLKVTETITLLPTEFLPEHLQFGKRHALTAVEDFPAVFDVKDYVDGLGYTLYFYYEDDQNSEYTFKEGTTYVLEINGKTYEAVCQSRKSIGEEDVIPSGNAFYCVCDFDIIQEWTDDYGDVYGKYKHECTIYLPEAIEGETVDVKLYEKTEVITPLDEKFMPVLTSPNGTKYKLTVADDGTLSATAVG